MAGCSSSSTQQVMAASPRRSRSRVDVVPKIMISNAGGGGGHGGNGEGESRFGGSGGSILEALLAMLLSVGEPGRCVMAATRAALRPRPMRSQIQKKIAETKTT